MPSDLVAGIEVTIQDGSAARDAGVPIPSEWPDPLRLHDAAAPDIGAIPAGVMPWRIGVGGRYSAFGRLLPAAPAQPREETGVVLAPSAPARIADPPAGFKPVAIVCGYPPIDEPMLRFAFKRHRAETVSLDRKWLDTKEYGDYSVVVIADDLQRADMKPSQYTADDIDRVRSFLEAGGSLWLVSRGARAFYTEAGQSFLKSLPGDPVPVTNDRDMKLRMPAHPWVNHLDPSKVGRWLKGGEPVTFAAVRGDCVIGTGDGQALLYQSRVGRGRLVWMGWAFGSHLPPGREKVTIEQEAAWEDQMKIVLKIAADLCSPRPGSVAP